MFTCIVTDDTLIDASGNPRGDAIIYGKGIVKCHPNVADKVQDGLFKCIGEKLEIISNVEWEEKNKSEFGES